MQKAELPTHSVAEKQRVGSKITWQELDLKGFLRYVKAGRQKSCVFLRPRLHLWLIRASTTILLWTCLLQLTAIGDVWGPYLLNNKAFCSQQPQSLVQDSKIQSFEQDVYPPQRKYKNNGYLMVSCNGGLNQMRAAICDMVAIAKLLNVTLVLPELDKASFWADPSDFGDIFDVNHFILSLRDQVRIVKQLPQKFSKSWREGKVITMAPVSWSSESYYLKQILPIIKKHKVLHLNRTDARLANNNLPRNIQKLRCRVNYHSLRFTPHIEELGQKIITLLKQKGPFLVLHLRYEMDMLAFSGCTHGCTPEEDEELTKLRYAYPWWKDKIIDSQQKRKDGLCPLTPEETALVLKALKFDSDTLIYVAAGEIYGSEKRMSALQASFPNIVRKEMLLSEEDLEPFQNRSSQMAAIDYLVSLASDIFIPTYDGNMAKVVEGHRRYLRFMKTIILDRRQLVQLIDQYHSHELSWDQFSLAVQSSHIDQMGFPSKRRVVPQRPKEEDYFYANPHECLPIDPSMWG